MFKSIVDWLTRAKVKRRIDTVDQRINQTSDTLHAALRKLDDIREQLQALNDMKEQLQMLRGMPEQLQMLHDMREQMHMLDEAIAKPIHEKNYQEIMASLPVALERQDGLSILIPCFNHGGVIHAAARSAQQALDVLSVPGEIIILNDASTDESSQVCDTLAASDERIRVIHAKGNLYLCRTRNVLLASARFKHYLNLDADNILRPEAVPVLYRAALDTGATMTLATIDVQGLAGESEWLLNCGPITGDLMKINQADTMSLGLTERTQQLGGWYTGPKTLVDDWEFASRLARLGDLFTFVPEVMGTYNVNYLSASKDVLDDRHAIYNRRQRSIQRFYDFDGNLNQRIRSCVYHPKIGYLWDNRGVQAKNSTVRILFICPLTPDKKLTSRDHAKIEAAISRCEVPLILSDGYKPPQHLHGAIWYGPLHGFDRHIEETCFRQGVGDVCYAAIKHAVLPFLDGSHITEIRGRSRLAMSLLDRVDITLSPNLDTENLARRLIFAWAAHRENVAVHVTLLGYGPFEATRNALTTAIMNLADVIDQTQLHIVDSQKQAPMNQVEALDHLERLGIERGQTFLLAKLDDFVQKPQAIRQADDLAATHKIPVVIVAGEHECDKAHDIVRKAAKQSAWYVSATKDVDTSHSILAQLAEKHTAPAR